MTDLTTLRHELVDRGASLLDDATTLAERGAHVAARLADEQASTLRSSVSHALPHSIPHSLPHSLRSIRRRRARARFAPPTWSVVLLVVIAVAGTLYWRSTRRPPNASRGMADHLESAADADASVPRSERVGAR